MFDCGLLVSICILLECVLNKEGSKLQRLDSAISFDMMKSNSTYLCCVYKCHKDHDLVMPNEQLLMSRFNGNLKTRLKLNSLLTVASVVLRLM